MPVVTYWQVYGWIMGWGGYPWRWRRVPAVEGVREEG